MRLLATKSQEQGTHMEYQGCGELRQVEPDYENSLTKAFFPRKILMSMFKVLETNLHISGSTGSWNGKETVRACPPRTSLTGKVVKEHRRMSESCYDD